MNSTLDTLPTNSNLLKWDKRSNAHCELCNGKETLLHTLNNCPTMLEQGRYTWRHNSVLNLIASMLVTHINQTNWKVFADLPKMTCSANSTIPQDILQTSQRPDIALMITTDKILLILELTVSFEQCIVDARSRKRDKYAALVNNIKDRGFKCILFTIEFGSRGLITKECASSLKSILKNC